MIYEMRLGFGEITVANIDEVLFYSFESQEMAGNENTARKIEMDGELDAQFN